MTERPILFSGPMVRAILEGRKSQTRRVLKNPEYYGCPTGDCPHQYGHECDAAMQVHALPDVRIKVGDTLWVRESWYCDDYRVQRGPYLQPDDMDLDQARADGILIYAADKLHPYEQEQPIWKPSIHMPRWASRITLKVTDVRVERLQDISEADAIAEGIVRYEPTLEDAAEYAATEGQMIENNPRQAFRDLWTSINGQASWDANPWVVAYSFERVKP